MAGKRAALISGVAVVDMPVCRRLKEQKLTGVAYPDRDGGGSDEKDWFGACSSSGRPAGGRMRM